MIRDMTITGGGDVDLGAGIYNSCVLSLDTVNISGNSTRRLTTTGNDQGGGIYSEYGSLHLFNTTIDNNQSRWAAGISFYADDATDVLVISNSTISNNAAVDLGGSGAIGAERVLLNTADAKLSIIGSTFSGNSSPVIGGIDVQGDSQLQITNCTITNNTATNAAVGGIVASDSLSARHTSEHYRRRKPRPSVERQ